MREVDGRTRFLGLLGRGIEHTLSPLLHNRALARLGENLVYLAFDLQEQEVVPFLQLYGRIGGLGLNVTTPYKEAAASNIRAGEEEVRLTGVVNTILFHPGGAVGYATDGRGLCSWIDAEGIPVGAGGGALLGFGAAGRSIAYQLAQRAPLTIVSREPAAVEATLQGWYARGWPGLPCRVQSWADPAPRAAVLTISALPPGFERSGEVARWLNGLDPAGTVVDLNYGKGRTPLRDQASDRGMPAHDGTGLLVHQAALSLAIWLGREVHPIVLQESLESGTV